MLMEGMAKCLTRQGFVAVTFDMRGAGKSSGWYTLRGLNEVSDVVAVAKWAAETLKVDKIVLVGSSGGAPIAGSALEEGGDIMKGYVGIGYPFGRMASLFFSAHHRNILHSNKPKLFVMGTADEFTSVSTFETKFEQASEPKFKKLFDKVSHFELETSKFDEDIAQLVADFVEKNMTPEPKEE